MKIEHNNFIAKYTNVYTAVSISTPIEIIWVVSLNFIL